MNIKIQKILRIYLLYTAILMQAKPRKESQCSSLLFSAQEGKPFIAHQKTTFFFNDLFLQKMYVQLSSQINSTSQEIKSIIQKIESIITTMPITHIQSLQEIQTYEKYNKETLITFINYLSSTLKEILALQLQNDIAKKNLDKTLCNLLEKSNISKKITSYESNKIYNNLKK